MFIAMTGLRDKLHGALSDANALQCECGGGECRARSLARQQVGPS